MNLIKALAARTSLFEGRGHSHDGEGFVGRLKVETLVDSKPLLFRYVATGDKGDVFHTEATLLGVAPDGNLCLWPAMDELPFVLPHPLVSCVAAHAGSLLAVFASGSRDAVDQFREEITVELKGNVELVYTHAWGMPGGAFEARSSCTLFASAA